MKSFVLLSKRISVLTGFCLTAGVLSYSTAQERGGVTFGAAGWMQYSVIGSSSDTGVTGHQPYRPDAFDGKNVLSPGAQLSLDAQLSERLHIAAGFGVVAGNTLPFSPLSTFGGYALPSMDAYVSNANFTYAFLNTSDSKLSLTGGLFPYDYNPDVKNLGLYLLRGPVYPGILISGFETKHVLPVANMLGFQLHHQMGRFQQDLLLSSDMEYYPFFDLSPAYVASFQVHPSFRIGAGVNFYHLIPVDGDLTSGLKSDGVTHWTYADPSDTVGGKVPDTTNLSYKGTKVMINASFDPKSLFGGAEWLGPEDLKLYSEVALIGLDNSAAYRKIYGDYFHRMPVMAGFNIPTFKCLDHLSLEVEWYGSAVQDNLDNYSVRGSSYPVSPFPTNWNKDTQSPTYNSLTYNAKRDNWKWSLHGAKTVQKHVQISLQIANDHYRPGIYQGYGDSNPPYKEAVLVTPKDWYLTAKLAYFF